MFVVTLRFVDKTKAPQYIDGHDARINAASTTASSWWWAVSAQTRVAPSSPQHSRTDFEARVLKDPFVAEGAVSADIADIAPDRTDERLAFLKA